MAGCFCTISLVLGSLEFLLGMGMGKLFLTVVLVL